jgi:hypothetical protein
MNEINEIKNTFTQASDGLLDMFLTMHRLDRTSVTLLEKHWLKAQLEVLQGLEAVIQHRLETVGTKPRPQKIALE